LTAVQLAKIMAPSLPKPLETMEVSSSEQSTSSEETTSDSSETGGSSGNSGSELESSSGSEPTTSDDSTSSDSDGEVTGEEEAQPTIVPATEPVKSSTAVESLTPKPELLPSENKSSNPVASDTSTPPIQPQPKPSEKEQWNPISTLAPEDPDSPKATDKNALVKAPAPNRSVTIISDLPPELAGGWGDEPTPAPWDWQGMPFDYMGILEEQRRTVYYELHERDGQEEWVLKNYKKGISPRFWIDANCRWEIWRLCSWEGSWGVSWEYISSWLPSL
jgi:hypothetical protein